MDADEGEEVFKGDVITENPEDQLKSDNWGVPYVAETRFPRGLFHSHEKMRFDAVNGLYF
jgi:hypothetical protein